MTQTTQPGQPNAHPRTVWLLPEDGVIDPSRSNSPPAVNAPSRSLPANGASPPSSSSPPAARRTSSPSASTWRTQTPAPSPTRSPPTLWPPSHPLRSRRHLGGGTPAPPERDRHPSDQAKPTPRHRRRLTRARRRTRTAAQHRRGTGRARRGDARTRRPDRGPRAARRVGVLPARPHPHLAGHHDPRRPRRAIRSARGRRRTRPRPHQDRRRSVSPYPGGPGPGCDECGLLRPHGP